LWSIFVFFLNPFGIIMSSQYIVGSGLGIAFNPSSTGLTLPVVAMLPAAGTPGRIKYDSATNRTNVDNGTVWQPVLTTSSGMLTDMSNAAATMDLPLSLYTTTAAGTVNTSAATALYSEATIPFSGTVSSLNLTSGIGGVAQLYSTYETRIESATAVNINVGLSNIAIDSAGVVSVQTATDASVNLITNGGDGTTNQIRLVTDPNGVGPVGGNIVLETGSNGGAGGIIRFNSFGTGSGGIEGVCWAGEISLKSVFATEMVLNQTDARLGTTGSGPGSGGSFVNITAGLDVQMQSTNSTVTCRSSTSGAGDECRTTWDKSGGYQTFFNDAVIQLGGGGTASIASVEASLSLATGATLSSVGQVRIQSDDSIQLEPANQVIAVPALAGFLPIAVVGPVPGITNRTAVNASIAATPIYTVLEPGLYSVHMYAVFTGVGSLGAFTARVLYDDPWGAQSLVVFTGSTTTSGNVFQGSAQIFAENTADIRFSTTMAGTGLYNIYVRVIAMT
jgi:hypothetical protein